MNLIYKKEDSLQQRLFYSNLTLYTQEKSPVRARNTDKLFLKKISHTNIKAILDAEEPINANW
jgi:hypothetical protein